MELKQFITERYEELAQEAVAEVSYGKMTATMEAQDKIMLDLLAEEFCISSTQLAGRLIQDAVLEMTHNMPLAFLEKACPSAEKKTHAYILKQAKEGGIKTTISGEITRWPHLLRVSKGEFDK